MAGNWSISGTNHSWKLRGGAFRDQYGFEIICRRCCKFCFTIPRSFAIIFEAANIECIYRLDNHFVASYACMQASSSLGHSRSSYGSLCCTRAAYITRIASRPQFLVCAEPTTQKNTTRYIYIETCIYIWFVMIRGCCEANYTIPGCNIDGLTFGGKCFATIIQCLDFEWVLLKHSC